MKAQSLLLRCCFITISLIYLVILASFFFPLYNGISAWQRIFPVQTDPALVGSYSVFINVVSFTLFLGVPLVLPPLAAWLALRFPTRMVSLVSLWISLPVTLIAYLVCSLFFEVPLFLPSPEHQPTTCLEPGKLYSTLCLCNFFYTLSYSNYPLTSYSYSISRTPYT